MFLVRARGTSFNSPTYFSGETTDATTRIPFHPCVSPRDVCDLRLRAGWKAENQGHAETGVRFRGWKRDPRRKPIHIPQPRETHRGRSELRLKKIHSAETKQ